MQPQQHRSQPQQAVLLGTRLWVVERRSSQDHNKSQSSEGKRLRQCEGVAERGQDVGLVAVGLLAVGLLTAVDDHWSGGDQAVRPTEAVSRRRRHQVV